MEKLVQEVIQWGKEKNIVKKENSYKQFCKAMIEGVAEVGTALNNYLFRLSSCFMGFCVSSMGIRSLRL